MTHVCCPDCRLRFTPATAAYLAACPACGEPPQTVAGPERMVGFRLFRLDDVRHKRLRLGAATACDAGRSVKVLEKRGQAKDHPVALGIPETSYLKCFICRMGTS